MKILFPYLFFTLFASLLSQKAQAQSKDASASDKIPVEWVDHGHRLNLPDSLSAVTSVDSSLILKKIKSYILNEFYYSGYFSGKIDSIKSYPNQSIIYTNRGNRYKVRSIRVDTESDSTGILNDWKPRYLTKNASYSQKKLQEDINQIIRAYENNGFPLIKVTIRNFNIHPDKKTVDLTLGIKKGAKITTSGVIITNVHKNDPQFLAKITGIRDSSEVTPHLLEMGRNNLQNSELFNSVSKGDIVERNDKYYVQYRVNERNPDSFDILLGYVPNAGRGGTIVGNGDLLLRNAVWNGSKLNLSFNRLQKYVTKLNIGFSKNWLLNIPLGLGADFHFLQQDSSYQIRNFTFQGSYNLNSATQLSATFRRQTVAVNANIIHPPPVLNGTGTYAGIGLNYQKVDNLLVPTHGLKLSVNIETGLKTITGNPTIQDTTQSHVHQKILRFYIQPYFNPFRRQVLTFSMHGYFIQSGLYTESDLIRFGGAKSFRGYREDQFMASRMLWGDTEYRYLLDPTSYAFIFGAAGTYMRPRINLGKTKIAKKVGLLHSFGFGFAFQTKIGQLKITYAKSPEVSFANAMIHISLRGNI